MQVAIKVDPEFKALIPPLSVEEHRMLDESIQAEGCRDALKVWDCENSKTPILLDGHNRFAICKTRGVDFDTTAIEGIETRDDALEWIIKNQLGRRNLDPITRVQLARRLEPVLRAKAEAHQKAGVNLRTNSDGGPKVDTMAEIAKVAGVSRTQAFTVERVEKNAVPALIEAVKAKKVSLHAADVVSHLPKKEQDKLIASGPAAVQKRAGELRKETNVEPKPEQKVDALMLLKQIIPDLRKGDCVTALAKIEMLAPWLVEKV